MKTILLFLPLAFAWIFSLDAYALEISGSNDVCPGSTVLYNNGSNLSTLCRAEWTVTGGLLINPFTGARVTSLTLSNTGTYNYSYDPVRVVWSTTASAGKLSVRVVECVLGLAFNDSDDIRIGPNTNSIFPQGPSALASCSSQQGTYSVTFPNAPNGTVPTVTWTTSTNLTIVSGRNSRNVVVRPINSSTSGNAWVRPSLNYGNCGGIRTLNSRAIWLNTTAFSTSQVSVSGTSGICSGEYTYLANVPGGYTSPYTYTWTIPSGWQRISRRITVFVFTYLVVIQAMERYR